MSGTFENKIYPTEHQSASMQDPGPDGPVVMVNLLKFKEKAIYSDGRETQLSGRAAYELYARQVGKLIIKHGGKVLYAGDTTFLQLGAVSPLWDEVALALYPARKNLLEMSSSAAWQEISVHREAGLEGQLNIETTPSFLPKESR